MTDYIRTDAELAHQHAYEAREAARHAVAAIHYRIVESAPPPADIITRGAAWRVVREISKKQEWSGWFFRRVEAAAYRDEQMRRDRAAAQRLGIHVHVTGDR
jgi:hypothetical protein